MLLLDFPSKKKTTFHAPFLSCKQSCRRLACPIPCILGRPNPPLPNSGNRDLHFFAQIIYYLLSDIVEFLWLWYTLVLAVYIDAASLSLLII